MKKYFTTIIVALSLLCSCAVTDVNLYRIKKDGLFGFIDSTGKEVIAPQYIIADRFNEGLALIVVDTTKINTRDYSRCRTSLDSLTIKIDNPIDTLTRYKYGYINYKNEIAIDTNLIYTCENIFDDFDKLRCCSNSIAFQDQKTGKYGFLNSKGEVSIPARFKTATNFSEGLAAVEDSSEKWGYVDSLGNTVIDFKFNHARSFSEDLASVSLTKTEKTDPSSALSDVRISAFLYFIDKNGNIALGPWNQWHHRIGYYKDGVAICANWIIERGYRFVNKQGQTLMPECIFDDVTNFKCGYAGIKIGNDWLFVDKNINVPVNDVFDGIMEFREGYAAVKKGDLWGFIDTTFQIKIPFQFNSIHRSFDNGLAYVQIDRCPIHIKAYINKDGEIKWQHQWSEWD